MRNVRFPYAAARVAACVLFAFAAVCYQGCDKAAEDPYAELDARFPEGNPGLADAQTRAQDPAYIEKLTQGANRYATLRAEAEKAKAKTERFRATIREGLTKRMGKEVPEALLEAELAKNAHYAGLIEAQRAAEEAAEAQRNENRRTIRERARAGMESYEALRAEADAKAKAAGLPVRAPVAATPTPAEAAFAKAQAAKAAAKAASPKAAGEAPTVKQLSEDTGIPVAPATNGQ